MSRLFYVTRGNSRSPLDWKYRENPAYGWNRFADKPAESLHEMTKFLSDNGKLNPPTLSFVDAENKPAVIAEVKMINGNKIDVRLNAGQRHHVLN